MGKLVNKRAAFTENKSRRELMMNTRPCHGWSEWEEEVKRDVVWQTGFFELDLTGK